MSIDTNSFTSSSSLSDQGRFSNAAKSLIQYKVPDHLLDEDDDNSAEDQKELDRRQQQETRLSKNRSRASDQLTEAEKDLSDFEELLRAYNAADSLKNPSDADSQTIQDMNTSVVGVVVEAGAGTVLARQIAKKALQLKKKVDDSQAEYDRICKVCFEMSGLCSKLSFRS